MAKDMSQKFKLRLNKQNNNDIKYMTDIFNNLNIKFDINKYNIVKDIKPHFCESTNSKINNRPRNIKYNKTIITTKNNRKIYTVDNENIMVSYKYHKKFLISLDIKI